MNDHTQWMQANETYLATALAWLRLRLEKLAAQETKPAQLVVEPVTEKPRGFFAGLFGRSAPQPAQPAEVPWTSLVPRDTDIVEAEQALTQAERNEVPPALMILAHRLELSHFEQQVLLLCAAMDLDTRIPSLCARAQGDPQRSYPTFALALTLFDEPVWNALLPQNPLRYWRLIEINQPGATPFTAAALRADERIVNYLKGLNYLDDRLAPLVEPLFGDVGHGEELPRSQEQQATELVSRLRASAGAGRAPVIELLGRESEGKRAVAWKVASTLGLNLYRLSAGLLPAQEPDFETFVRLWQRESLLMPIALYLDMGESVATGAHDTQAAATARFLGRAQGVVFLDVEEPQRIPDRPVYSVEIQKPTPQEQRSAWLQAIGEGAEDLSGRLAAQFNLSRREIEQIAAAVPDETEADILVEERLWEGCLAASRPKLERLAQRIDAKATWDDIVLPEEERALLRQIAEQVRQRSRVYEDWGFRQRMNRGLGISALFAGESGTGKTMAAEVIANDLKLHLYRIDLSAVVNKYIGETEKNLRRVFDAAEDSGAILFFDEADALFGKRSEVKDSHDRYANIEINYLLQRMEAYRGLAILATNMKSALDQAFMRRLRFIVNFQFPGAKERKLIWQHVFPKADASRGLAGTPVEGLNYDRLAKLNLTGGSIHNIALNAAFLAAQAGTPVTMPIVMDAARTEFRKLERPINEADFRILEAVGKQI
ncbi:ATPase AAA [Candidatus Methylomirabilis lanthanidiphila]|uniref:ATPase AAA n=1 Tax=Candidatus Methylomirabilis lanthanidiphila TaxID=2211376 RepID=A0A564ZGX7_9BACT|nr:ATP-binding protein [Candidatus Methylomirabilis lanthanidiphila]VUZ83902.1 ATPase AAA [Candidatus Methylomirabilis lanthanidiphila]